MTEVEEQQNNPLHGLKLETLVTELVEHYGWEILYTAMRFHCFKTNPNIKGCVKFLKKTDWAREKLEAFYLYRFKRMPRPSDEQFKLLPRERGFKAGIVPLKPMVLTVESIELSQAKAASAFKSSERDKSRSKARSHNSRSENRKEKFQAKSNKSGPSDDPSDPWGLKNK